MNNSVKIKALILQKDSTLIQALKRMDELDKKLLLVFDSEQFIGLISIGDIQRAIIKNQPLNSRISEVMRKNIRVCYEGDSKSKIRELMMEFRTECMPILNENNELVDIIFWENEFSEKVNMNGSNLDVPIVIMAGGLGTRLKPLTNVIPKPLIPIGDKTMLEEIFERFARHGCNDFYISVNYKSDLIEFYLKNQNLKYNILLFKEEKPMGTAGSLSLLKDKLKQTFFVNNCDILINEDYSQILEYHRENRNEITLVAALKTFDIAYGTIESGDNGMLINLEEKPSINFMINSGMYVLEPHLLNEIPCDEFFHITNLIDKVKRRSGKIGVYPVSNSSWKDIGTWNDYLSLINKG